MEISNLIKKVPENSDMFPVATAAGGNARVTLQQIAMAIKPAIAMTDTERAQLTSAYNAVADLPPGKDVTDYVTGVVGTLETRAGALRVLPFDGEYFDGGATPSKGIYYHRIARDDSGEFLCFGQTTFADYGLSEDDYASNKIPYQLYVRDGELYRVREDTGIMESFTDVAKMQNFIDRWNEAWKIGGVQYGKYDPDNAPDAGHPFRGNGLWMTYEEALDVWEYSVHEPFTNLSGAFTNVPCRTFLPLPYRSVNYRGAISLKGMCARNENVEAVNVGVIKASDLFDAFAFAKKLKKIVGTIDVSEITNVRNFWYFTDGALVLSEISLKGLKVGISMRYNPLLSLASLQYLIANAANTATITVTVHPDVYAKLTGDTTNAAAAALSTEEAAKWQQVVTDAAAKNISFATV